MPKATYAPRSTAASRTRRMYELYATGATLEKVGKRFGPSCERVRQIFHEAGLPTRSVTETRSLCQERFLERAHEVVAAYEECGDVKKVARRLDVPQAFVKEMAAKRFPAPKRRRRHRSPPRRKYPTAEMIAFLREAAVATSKPLALGEFRRYAEGRRTADGRAWPSIYTYTARFGSWRNALVAAGLPAGPRRASGTRRRFSEQDCIDALREAAEALGDTPKTTAYNRLARSSNGRLPVTQTVRHRLGSWYDALTKAGL